MIGELAAREEEAAEYIAQCKPKRVRSISPWLLHFGGPTARRPTHYGPCTADRLRRPKGGARRQDCGRWEESGIRVSKTARPRLGNDADRMC